MKKKLLFATVAVTVSISYYHVTRSFDNNETKKTWMDIYDVEALTDCEKINGSKPNGHCVENDRLEYFCAKPGFLQSKNCMQ